MGCIYAVTNLKNNKKYVGQTSRTAEYRYNEHCKAAKTGKDINIYFHNALRKYGTENFKLEVLEDNLTDEELNDREIYWIEKMNTFSNGYNMTIGGDGTSKYTTKELENAYLKYGSINKASKSLGCTRGTMSCRLKDKYDTSQNIDDKRLVYAINLNNPNKILKFESAYNAARYVEEHLGQISDYKKRRNEVREILRISKCERRVFNNGKSCIKRSYKGFTFSFTPNFEKQIEHNIVNKEIIEKLHIEDYAA